MRPAKLGTITIGQAPRPDVTPMLARHVPAGVETLHVGVLDRLSDADIAAQFAPRANQSPRRRDCSRPRSESWS